MRQFTRYAFWAAVLTVFFAACGRNPDSAAAPAQPEVIIVARETVGGSSSIRLAAPPQFGPVAPDTLSGVSEDLNDKPNSDLPEGASGAGGMEYRGPQADCAESPHPNRGPNTLGLGGMGGGGGKAAGQSRYAHRLAKGASGQPGNEPQESAFTWLVANAVDGSWPDPTGDANQTARNTAMALLAFAGAGYTHKVGPYKSLIRDALLRMRRQQNNSGAFVKLQAADDLLAHLMLTCAIAEIQGVSHDYVLHHVLTIAHSAIEACRLRHTNIFAPGLRIHAWMHCALTALEDIGIGQNQVALKQIEDGLKLELVDSNGQRIVGDGSAADAGAWLFCMLRSGNMRPAHQDAQDAALQTLFELCEADDPDSWYWASMGQYQAGGTYWDEFARIVPSRIHDTQNTDGKHKGSWTPGKGQDRAYLTAAIANVLNADCRYLRPTAKSAPDNPDADKDSPPDPEPEPGTTEQGSGGLLFRVPGTGTVPGIVGDIDVRAQITGGIASTTLTQTFTNPYNRNMEAIYTFPLPAEAAVNGFTMLVGDSRIVGLVLPRQMAVQAYREAKARGQRATLMTQQRPNVFTQSVANIEAASKVVIEVRYHELLSFRDGAYDWNFPLTIGKRYGEATQADRDGDGVDDPDDVDVRHAPDSGRRVKVAIELAPGLALDASKVRSLNHVIETAMARDGTLTVTHSGDAGATNRDFVLRWTPGAEQAQAALWTHRGPQGAHLLLQLQPPLELTDQNVTRREITYVVDVSGSMAGDPARICRDVVRQSLATLRPGDTFNLISFASETEQLFDRARAGSDDTLKQAESFLTKAGANGGTELLQGLRTALDAPHDLGALQVYVFLTDGYIQGEAQVLAEIAQRKQQARFFAFGVGPSINHHLIEGIARQGDGRSHCCYPRNDRYSEDAAESLAAMLDSPVMTDIEIDWGGLRLSDVQGEFPRDLYGADPLRVLASFIGDGEYTVTLRARRGGVPVEFAFAIDLTRAQSHEAIPVLWARKRIADLTAQQTAAPWQFDHRRQIQDIALRYNLASSQTAFVAVDESHVVGHGVPLVVLQPLDAPENGVLEGVAGIVRRYTVKGWGLVLGEGEDGRLRVLEVEDGSDGAKAGMVKGLVIDKVNGRPVRDVAAFERELQDTPREPVLETEVDDSGRTVRARFTMPSQE